MTLVTHIVTLLSSEYIYHTSEVVYLILQPKGLRPFWDITVITARNWKMLTILYFIVANIQQRGIDLNRQWKIYYGEKGAMTLLA